jgi:GTPase SAR1 family protein
VLCGNKVDLAAARQVSTVEGQELADTMKAPFFETSAKTRVNVQEAFITVVREARRLLRPEIDRNKGANKKKCTLL